MGYWEDFDLFFEEFSKLLENLIYFFNKYLHHLWRTIILLISCGDAYAHLFILKLPLFPIVKGPLLFIGLSEVSYLLWKVFCCSKDLYLWLSFFPTELISLAFILEFRAALLSGWYSIILLSSVFWTLPKL